MVGIPPTVGFFSKWYLLLGIVQSEKIYLFIILIVSTLLNASYYFPMIYRSYFCKNNSVYKDDQVEDSLLILPIIIVGVITIMLFFGVDSIIIFTQGYIIK